MLSQSVPEHCMPTESLDVTWSVGVLYLSWPESQTQPWHLPGACGSPGLLWSLSQLLHTAPAPPPTPELRACLSLLKNNTTATAPGSSCTNLGCFDSTLFQPCALQVLWECFLPQLMVAELWHRRTSPGNHQDSFSAKTCPWSALGAFQAPV